MILNFDCLTGLEELAENSVDLLTTDPPYGISFMGKSWDEALPDKRIWKECLRVLKPGAFAFVMCIPRADCLSRMIISLEDAGFRVNFTPIFWTYATGFPKAQNIGKAVDKKLGIKPLEIKPASGVGFMNTKDDGYHTTKNQEIMPDRTTPQAKTLDGSYGGSQPKPAVEVIIVCMKPLSEKTFVDQSLLNRKGITWLDDCRVPYESEGDKGQATPQGKCTSKEISAIGAEPDAGRDMERVGFARPKQQGRFPANLLVSDDVLNDGQIRKAGKYKGEGSKSGGIWHQSTGKPAGMEYGDSGSFSRYFDLDKWWEERVKELPESVQKTLPFIIVPKASKSEKNKGCEDLEPQQMGRNQSSLDGGKILTGSGNERSNYKRNYHPTVKPIKLMSYLVTLGSREGDVVVDPFMGSGTTGIACEMLGRKFIGYEIDKDYFEIAKRRIEVCKK